MATPSERLSALLCNTEGLDHSMLYDHDSDSWVQTRLGIDIRTGIIRPWKHTEADMGILDHVSDDDLRADIYPLDAVLAEFPNRKRKAVTAIYERVKTELADIGYQIQELPPDVPIETRIMGW